LEVVSKINEVFTDNDGRPLQAVRIKHTIILDDPFPDPVGLEQHIPDRSPLPPKDQWENLLDEEEMEKLGKPDERTQEEIEEELKDKEAKSRQDVLIMVIN
jgi:peptidyl-prolyl cis-trans isomerase-like 4